MTDITQILSRIEAGDPTASNELLPLVYNELRRLAAHRLAQEKPGQTLQATALVHEAYLRLVDGHKALKWDSRGHFFAAAAEAMRRILIEQARAKGRQKRQGERRRLDIDAADVAVHSTPDQPLAIDDALTKLQREDAAVFELVRLRYFAGLNVDEAAAALGISSATAYRHWNYASAWRDHFGSAPVLPNDDTAGVGQDDMDRWKTNFDNQAGIGALTLPGARVSSSASGNLASVPEPVSSSQLLLLTSAFLAVRHRWSVSTQTRYEI